MTPDPTWDFWFRDKRFQNPSFILSEEAGRFVELPTGIEVDPVEWLLERQHQFYLAGAIAYEFAWHLDEIHATRPASDAPLICVGAFSEVGVPEVPVFEPTGGLKRLQLPSRDAYTEAVSSCIGSIFEGEIFEVNFTGRFEYEWSGSVGALFSKMKSTASGDLMGYLVAEGMGVVSISPESFLDIDDRKIVTRPIKGTRPRFDDPEEDRASLRELETSEKDRAENVMIVDLMRNDLAKVCRPGTVRATEICAVESYIGVHHMVSRVEGVLGDGVSPMQALLTCFPAGSITGAPKLRAIEIAAGLESGPREYYTGSLFYCSPEGRLESSVAIRTATLHRANDRWRVVYGAGGAIVADSDPLLEFEEAQLKARYLEQAVD